MPIESVMPSNHLILCHPFSSSPQSFPASGSLPMSQLLASGGQRIGASALAVNYISVKFFSIPKNKRKNVLSKWLFLTVVKSPLTLLAKVSAKQNWVCPPSGWTTATVDWQCCVNFCLQQSDSVIHIHVPFHILFLYSLSQDVDCSSLCSPSPGKPRSHVPGAVVFLDGCWTIMPGASFSAAVSVAGCPPHAGPFQPGFCLKDSAWLCPPWWKVFMSPFIHWTKNSLPGAPGGVRSTRAHPSGAWSVPPQERIELSLGEPPWPLHGVW